MQKGDLKMDFAFSQDHEQIRRTVRDFSEKVLAPLVREADDNETFPRHVFAEWAKLGLLGVRYPEADGGSGFDKIADCIVREETSRISQGFAIALSCHSHLGLWPIWKAGTPSQKQRFFKAGIEGKKISAFSLSEPDGGSDIRSLKTRAEKVDGGWILKGSKVYITNSPIADFLVLAARTRPELTNDAISLFIVEMPNPDVRIDKLKKEGVRASETGLIHLDGAFVPDDCLLGGQQGTYPIILESLSENRVGVAANCLGMARGAFEAALDYANSRNVRGQPIANFQAIGHKLADMAAEIEAARWMVYYGAWRVDQGTIDFATAVKAASGGKRSHSRCRSSGTKPTGLTYGIDFVLTRYSTIFFSSSAEIGAL
jgi:alkylation response protein AidB-like acyl-CoA dehydrogenase